MVDTFTLQWERLEIEEKYLGRFDQSKRGKSLKYMFNPDIESDGYLPSITIRKGESREGGYFTDTVDIQASAAKVRYGSNAYGVDENDYDALFDDLTTDLGIIFNGSPLARDLLENGNLRTVAIPFNFVWPDAFGEPVDFLKKVSVLDVGKKLKWVRTTSYYENQRGYCVTFWSKPTSVKFYDKTAELVNHSHKTEEDKEVIRKMKVGLLPPKILRMEVTFQNRTSLKNHFAVRLGNAGEERYLKEAFDNEFCKSILLGFFDELANEINTQALNTPLYPIADCIRFIKEAGMYLPDAYMWLGRSLAIQQVGSLQLKKINDRYFNRQGRARFDKRFEGISALRPLSSFTLGEIFDELRRQLNEFKIIKPDYSFGRPSPQSLF